MKFSHLCIAGFFFISPLVSKALVFSPTAASTTMSLAVGSLDNTINGLGLTGAVHAASAPGDSWAGNIPFPTTGSVTFGLGGLYSLTGLSLWNLNGSAADFGLKNVNITFSTDGLAFDGSIAKAFAVGTTAAEEISFISAVEATHVRFEILNNQGNAQNIAGFSEIKFTGDLVARAPGVPDGGSTLGILGATLLGLVGLRRRLNRH